jgi:hypothetical protein
VAVIAALAVHFMTLKPVPNAVIEEIVDTIFLPLARG